MSYQIAEMISESVAADGLTLATASGLDKRPLARRAIANANKILARVPDAALPIGGVMGLMSRLPVARLRRDTRGRRNRGGTSTIRRHFIGRDLRCPMGS